MKSLKLVNKYSICKLLCLILCAFYTTNGTGQKLELSIKVNGKEFDPLNESVAKNDSIILELINKDTNAEYSFKEVTVLITLKKIIDVGKGIHQKDMKELKENLTKREFKKVKKEFFMVNSMLISPAISKPWLALDSYEIYYGDFSKNPQLIIPYLNFYDKCLVRVILSIKGLEIKKDSIVREISSRDFDYTKTYEFWPDWDCKKTKWLGQ